IRQNTAALHGASDNVLFERHLELVNQFTADPSLAAIMVTMRSDDPQLNEVDAVRWERYQVNLLDIWVQAYMRHQAELLSDRQWHAWDAYFTDLFSDGAEKFDRPFWERYQFGFDTDFWNHVDRALFPDSGRAQQ
ncbi:MAG: hypothetical protein R3212_02865, partial [Xanthomonadales bacterium]|nr:hypothetical protein [Xanthomonadales bacterium]